jgi:hypothetical protein
MRRHGVGLRRHLGQSHELAIKCDSRLGLAWVAASFSSHQGRLFDHAALRRAARA